MLEYKSIVDDLSFINKYFKNENSQIYNELNLQSKQKDFKFVSFVFFDNKNPAGFILVSIPKDKSKVVFIDIYISNAYKEQGTGPTIYALVEDKIKYMLQKLNKKCIYTIQNNKNSRVGFLFTRRLGYVSVPKEQTDSLKKENSIPEGDNVLMKCYF